MIQLLRAYIDGRVIAAEAYDHDELLPQPDVPPWARMRCSPTPVWQSRMAHLATFGGYDKVTVTSIYPSTKSTT